MTRARTEGVILHTFDYGDYDQIITSFSPDLGVQKFIYSRKKRGALTPISKCEFIYLAKDRTLLRCSEIHPVSHYRATSLERLEASCSIARIIRQTQQPGTAEPILYTLVIKYFEKILTSDQPETLAASFVFKLFKHDGRIDSMERCSVCGHLLSALFFADGESFCEQHATAHSLFFVKEEMLCLQVLLHSRTFSHISRLAISKRLKEKIKRLSQSMIDTL